MWKNTESFQANTLFSSETWTCWKRITKYYYLCVEEVFEDVDTLIWDCVLRRETIGQTVATLSCVIRHQMWCTTPSMTQYPYPRFVLFTCLFPWLPTCRHIAIHWDMLHLVNLVFFILYVSLVEIGLKIPKYIMKLLYTYKSAYVLTNVTNDHSSCYH